MSYLNYALHPALISWARKFSTYLFKQKILTQSTYMKDLIFKKLHLEKRPQKT